jgi:hypothetical protein
MATLPHFALARDVFDNGTAGPGAVIYTLT